MDFPVIAAIATQAHEICAVMPVDPAQGTSAFSVLSLAMSWASSSAASLAIAE